MVRVAMQQVTQQLAARGEPWKAFFDTDELNAELEAIGFSEHCLFGPDLLNQRYLAQRNDGLHVGAGPSRLILATV
jgi:O-methyltransferase involved in polyketide biosynthesis